MSTYWEIDACLELDQRSKMEHFGKIIIVSIFAAAAKKKLCLKSCERVLNKCRVLNISEFWMFVHFSKYDSVLSVARLWICKGYSGCRICLNKPEYTLMPQHVWICLNNAEYKWICRHIPERNRVLNMPEFWMCLMQYIAYGHCTNYWAVIETDIQNTITLSNI